MPTPVVNAVKVTVSGTYLGELCENVWHVFGGAGAPTVSDLQTIAGIFETAYGALVVPLSDQLFINSISTRFLGDPLGPEAETFITPALQGGSASPGMPGNVAFCIRLRSGSPGRSNRGRKYISGLTEAVVAGNSVSGTFADALVAAIDGLITALESNGTNLAIVSYTNATVVFVTDAGYFDLNTDSMRRRLAGRGR